MPIEKPTKKTKLRSRPSRWLLKSYLYLLIFIYTMAVMLTFFLIADMKYMLPKQLHVLQKFPSYTFEFLIILSIMNIYFLRTILRKKRWGFWGFCFSGGIAAVGLNLYMGQNLARAVIALGGVMILYLLLRTGGKRSAWEEMT